MKLGNASSKFTGVNREQPVNHVSQRRTGFNETYVETGRINNANHFNLLPRIREDLSRITQFFLDRDLCYWLGYCWDYDRR